MCYYQGVCITQTITNCHKFIYYYNVHSFSNAATETAVREYTQRFSHQKTIDKTYSLAIFTNCARSQCFPLLSKFPNVPLEHKSSGTQLKIPQKIVTKIP